MASRSIAALALALPLLSACAPFPAGTYFPDARDPATQKVGHALRRAALAAGDDPARYNFALVRAEEAQIYRDNEATLYVTDGLVRLSGPVLDAMVAHAVAHEALEHMGQRRAWALSMSTGFTVAGIVLPGTGLADFLVNPLVVRAVSRDQVLKADLKAVEILRAMGYESPRRVLAAALQAVEAVNGKRMPRATFLDTTPSLDERLAALEPLEPPSSPVAEVRAPAQ
jgi:Zn-dependent protease with chaperone function